MKAAAEATRAALAAAGLDARGRYGGANPGKGGAVRVWWSGAEKRLRVRPLFPRGAGLTAFSAAVCAVLVAQGWRPDPDPTYRIAIWWDRV